MQAFYDWTFSRKTQRVETVRSPPTSLLESTLTLARNTSSWVSKEPEHTEFALKPRRVVEAVQTLPSGHVADRAQGRVNIAITLTCGTATNVHLEEESIVLLRKK
jgi:hypothetical protein